MRTYTAYRLMETAGAQAHATTQSIPATRMCYRADRRLAAITKAKALPAPSRLARTRAKFASHQGGTLPATDLTSLRITVLGFATQHTPYVLALTQALSP